MKLQEYKKYNIKPLRNLIAFRWLKPKLKSSILIPDKHYSAGLRPGHFYIGKVLEIGPEVIEIKKGDAIMIHEYGIKTMLQGRGFEEDEIYFIEEENCRARVDDLKEEIPLTDQVLDDKELERMDNA